MFSLRFPAGISRNAEVPGKEARRVAHHSTVLLRLIHTGILAGSQEVKQELNENVFFMLLPLRFPVWRVHHWLLQFKNNHFALLCIEKKVQENRTVHDYTEWLSVSHASA
jgi:hypothetical protein